MFLVCDLGVYELGGGGGHLVGVLIIRGILLFGGLVSVSPIFVNPQLAGHCRPPEAHSEPLQADGRPDRYFVIVGYHILHFYYLGVLKLNKEEKF